MTIRNCPVCHTEERNAKIFHKQNINPSLMSQSSFASRKVPEFMCHQLVQCVNCDLVYANNPPDQSVLANAYHTASFDSAQEADDAALAYSKAISPILDKIKNKEAALEIGTGTGIFLDILKNKGFSTVIGVEPSTAAINAAPSHRKEWILESIFKESDFQLESFDFICCFMTLEHVRDPQEIVSAASRLLRPGGAIALVTHDYRSGINRLFGKRSPIIDIEHMQLFSEKSIRHLLECNGFESIKVKSFKNWYALSYWMRLMPIPVRVKTYIIKRLDLIGIAKIKIGFNVGNIMSFGYRPQK